MVEVNFPRDVLQGFIGNRMGGQNIGLGTGQGEINTFNRLLLMG
jgi:hypothetical protein